MELTEIVQYKSTITAKLNDTVNNFVVIGFCLRKIRESGELEGCADIYEFAHKNWGISKSTSSRFMAINEKYSLDGYSEELKPEFKEFKYSQLQEMLTLPDKELETITPVSTVNDIRTVKEYAKEEEERKEGVQQSLFQKPEKITSLQGALKEYFRGKRKVFNDTVTALQISEGEEQEKKLKEIFAPSGYATCRAGLVLIVLNDSGAEVRKFGAPSQKMSWSGFGKEISALLAGYDHTPTYDEVFPEELEITYTPNANPPKQNGALEGVEDKKEDEEAKCQSAKETSRPEGISGGIYQPTSEEAYRAAGGEIHRTEEPHQAGEELHQAAGEAVATSQLPRVEGEIVINEPKKEQKYQGELKLSYEGSENVNQVTDSPADVVPHTEPRAGSAEGIDRKKERFLELTRADRASYADALQYIEMDSACFSDGKNVNLELMERHVMKLEQMRGKLGRMMREWRTIYGD